MPKSGPGRTGAICRGPALPEQKDRFFRKRALDGVADLGAKAELFEFHAQSVPQWAFRAQLVDQRFGFRKRVFTELGPGEQLTPGSRCFLFSQQFGGPFVRPEGISSI